MRQKLFVVASGALVNNLLDDVITAFKGWRPFVLEAPTADCAVRSHVFSHKIYIGFDSIGLRT